MRKTRSLPGIWAPPRAHRADGGARLAGGECRMRGMLRFLVYENGEPAAHWMLRNAHLVGVDDVGIRSNIRFEDGQVLVEKAAAGPAALALQVAVEGAGELLLQTCLLPERAEPYNLSVELARHRLMKLIAKQEDWAMFDVEEG